MESAVNVHATDAPRVFVQTVTGRRMALAVPRGGTVKELKQLIHEQEQIPIEEQQRVTFGGTPLQDDVALETYDIQPDSTLMLSLRRGPELSMCPECKEPYGAGRLPRVLNCLDVVCQQCVVQLTKAQKFVCSQCGVETHVNSEQELLCAFHVLQIADEWMVKTGKPVGCGQCDDPATHWCTTCSKVLCSGCQVQHHKLRKTQSHVVQLLDESRQSLKPSPPPTYCTQHTGETSNKLTVFCNTCQMAICVKCIKQTHKEHDCKNPDQVLDGEKKKLLDLATSILPKCSQLTDAIKNVGSAMHQLTERQKCAEQELKDIFQRAMEALKAREQQSLAELDAVCNRKRKTLAEQQQQLELVLDQVNRRKFFVQEAIHYDSAVQLLASKKLMVNALSSLPEANTALQTSPEIKLNGQLDSLMGCLRSLGSTLSTDVCLDKCTAEGPGLTGARTGQAAEFTVSLRTAMGEPAVSSALNVRGELEHEGATEEVPVDVSDYGRSTFLCRYEVKHPGALTMNVLAAGHHIPGSPFTLSARACDPWNWGRVPQGVTIAGSRVDFPCAKEPRFAMLSPPLTEGEYQLTVQLRFPTDEGGGRGIGVCESLSDDEMMKWPPGEKKLCLLLNMGYLHNTAFARGNASDELHLNSGDRITLKLNLYRGELQFLVNGALVTSVSQLIAKNPLHFFAYAYSEASATILQ